MAQDVAQLATQLEQLNVRLERALKARQGGGPLRPIRPFFFGALLGAGAALLYAPQTGERTREFLRRNAGELQESATQSTQTAKDTIQRTATTAKSTAQQTLTQVGDRAATAAQNGRAKTGEIVQGAKQTVKGQREQAGQVVDTGGTKAQAVAEDGGATVQTAAATAADKAAQAPRAHDAPPQVS